MLKFATFTSDVEFPFWATLATQKLEKDGLNDAAQRIQGVYDIKLHHTSSPSCCIQVHSDALTGQNKSKTDFSAEGSIRIVNTFEQFKDLDKGATLHGAGLKILRDIDEGAIISKPSLLVSFVIICFADIKRYKFTYLFGFPALHSDLTWKFSSATAENGNETASARNVVSGSRNLGRTESEALTRALQHWRSHTEPDQVGFFIARRQGPSALLEEGHITTPAFWEVAELREYEHGFFHAVEEQDRFFGFVDPSDLPMIPGWPLRNYLMLLSRRWGLRRVQIISHRRATGTQTGTENMLLPIELAADFQVERATTRSEDPKITGWERNATGKIVSKTINVGEYLDPLRLAEQAVDLNLKLMRWRIAPNLELEKIKGTKCLLLGAGTLGCYVSRNLLGWGVEKITFVDYGNVSYSNPVRQPLFKYTDCLNGGLAKAHQAAKALREIYPGVQAQGHVLSVPMAGHPIIDEERTRSDLESLQQLILEHDAVFELMDSRESRWLPTIIGKSSGKIVMNAALGFDSYVTMRHGARDLTFPDKELGCYFCNDVVAPLDSLSARTLDQQCTVTRPGVAAIAAGLLVEIFVNLLQHPLGVNAPADSSAGLSEQQADHSLGMVPHQIRGFLSSFENVKAHGKAYQNCSACSESVLKAYENDPWAFLKRALNEKGYVEELSGLAEVQRSAEKAFLDIEAIDDFNDEDGDEAILL